MNSFSQYRNPYVQSPMVTSFQQKRQPLSFGRDTITTPQSVLLAARITQAREKYFHSRDLAVEACRYYCDGERAFDQLKHNPQLSHSQRNRIDSVRACTLQAFQPLSVFLRAST